MPKIAQKQKMLSDLQPDFRAHETEIKKSREMVTGFERLFPPFNFMKKPRGSTFKNTLVMNRFLTHSADWMFV
jgi:hypothetical protein